MLIFIIGYMGAGKTTLGKIIADRLNYRFYDLDEMIGISTGYTIASYFEHFGEAAFRQKEREILINHLLDKDTVIATGGGTPCFEDGIDLMNRSGVTVFIDISFETVMQRLKGKFSTRPLLKNIPPDRLPEFIRDHLESRRIFYEKAHLKVDGEQFNIDKLLSDFTTF